MQQSQPVGPTGVPTAPGKFYVGPFKNDVIKLMKVGNKCICNVCFMGRLSHYLVFDYTTTVTKYERICPLA